MRAGADVLRLEGLGERADGRAVGVLEQAALRTLELDDPAEVSRVEEELRVVAAVEWDLGERIRAEPAREALDEAEQLQRAERLREVRIGTRVRGVAWREVDEAG